MIRHVAAVAIVLVLGVTPVFAQSAPAAGSELIVKTAAAAVHKFPSIGSPIIGQAARGTALEVRRNLGSWVEVPWPAADAGIAFMHVNTGTLAPRVSTGPSAGALAAIAEIKEVEAACTSGISMTAAQRAGQAGSGRVASRSAAYALPSHHIGVGALMNNAEPRFGATGRAWWGERLGVQFSLAQPHLYNADGLKTRSTSFAPAVLYSLPDAVTNTLWLRPYVGGGPRFYRANLSTELSYEALGGAEFTLAAVPQFSLSADLAHRWRRPSFDGFEPRRVAFSVSGHWYLK
jgi:hypothetical protein